MGKIYRTKIFRRLFLSILTVTLVNFAAMYAVIFFRSRALIDARELELADSYRQEVSERLLDWLKEQEESVVQLAENLAIDLGSGLGESFFDRRINACANSQDSFSDVFSVDAEGRMTHLSSAGRTPRIDVADRDYFRASMDGKVFASGFFLERIHGTLSLAVSAPIFAGGEGARPVGIAVGLLRFDEVESVVTGLSGLAGLGSVLVLDGESRRLAGPTAAGISAGPLRTRAAVELAARRSGAAKYLDADGKLAYGSYGWLEGLALGLVVELSADMARAPLIDVLRFASIFMALIVAALTIDAWLLSLSILKPIGKLSDAAEQLAKDQYPDPLGLHTGTELDGIGDCFDRMALAIRDREFELKDSAARDSLTGLYNHAKIEERLALELSGRRKGDEERPALVMLDLDHFKAVNDDYGHAMGDEVLRSVARALEATSREFDFIGRYGGEEFAVVLRGLGAEGVARYCERLRAAVAALVFDGPAAGGFSVTASLGWALCRPEGETPTELIARADAGLYAAKADGRDCAREGPPAGGRSPLQNPTDRG
jgi:diguanylate cyclase (GGDEF)-like protein